MNISLRPWQQHEAPILSALANNPAIAANMMDQFPMPYTPEVAEQFIARNLAASPTLIHAIIWEGQPVGSIGIHPQSDIDRFNGELGYWLGEPFWGKGIITQAIRLKVENVFQTLDLQRIFARPFGRNLASAKALENAGFVLEAKLSQTRFKLGQWEDELIYAIRRPQS
jgi:RimJ/RimL family protein N-acetyltransferase